MKLRKRCISYCTLKSYYTFKINWDINDKLVLTFTRGANSVMNKYFNNIIRVLSNFLYNLNYEINKTEYDKSGEIELFHKLREEYYEMKTFKHDYTNILCSISAYIQDNDIKGLEQYFNSKILNIDFINDSKLVSIGSLSNLKVKELRGMILSKIILAQKNGIDVKINIPKEIEEINSIGIITVTRCLGILIDNAIEAAEKCSEPDVSISILKGYEDINCIVSNNFIGNDINIHDIYKKGVTSKGKDRGLGLYIIKKLLAYEENVLLHSEIDNDIFIQELVLLNTNKEIVVNEICS